MSIRLEARNKGNIRLDMDNASLAAKYAREAETSEKAAELSAANAAGAAERADTAATAASCAAASAQAAAIHPPQPGQNGTWLVWDQAGGSYVDSGANCVGVQGERGLKGDPGALSISGSAGSRAELPSAVEHEGELWLVSSIPGQPEMLFYANQNGAWEYTGTLQGPKGDGLKLYSLIDTFVSEDGGNISIRVESEEIEDNTFQKYEKLKFYFRNIKGNKGDKGDKGDPGNYTKPADGIPATDLAEPVQDSLDHADDTYTTTTVSGSIATFDAPAEGLPVKKLVVNIEPVQEGTGDPSPENVRPISGWPGCILSQSGADTSNPSVKSIAFPTPPGTVYSGTLTINADGTAKLQVDKMMLDLSAISYESISSASNGIVGKGGHSYQNNNTPIADILSQGIAKTTVSTLSSRPLNSIYIKWSNYYPFEVKVPSEYDTNSKIRAYLSNIDGNGAHARILLNTTAKEYTLTASQVLTLLGINNIWADCGDVSVEYGDYLAASLNSVNAHSDTEDNITRAMLAPVEQGAAASQNYAIGDMLVFSGKLCKATAAISSGETLTLGTNLAATTIAEQLALIWASINT